MKSHNSGFPRGVLHYYLQAGVFLFCSILKGEKI